jgi:hypothetical protein
MIPFRFHMRQDMLKKSGVRFLCLLFGKTVKVDNPFLLRSLDEVPPDQVGLQIAG